ncbi:MAG TPA: aldo/keto reductase [Spirochaetia bacterium]|nr:aldo/keto reductase [Spirochaetia bacterium]
MNPTVLKPRSLGTTGVKVSGIGLGMMSMGHAYGRADDEESVATLERALELGVNFFDTADFYGVGHSEEILKRVVGNHRREELFISVKVGPMVLPGGGFSRPNGDPDYIKNVLAYDLARIGVDYIDLYFPSRVDDRVPIEAQMEALVEMNERGFIRHIGLSEASAATVRRAHAVHPIAAVQTEYSLWSRDPEDELLPTMRELGIALVGYAPLSRGFLSGKVRSNEGFDRRDIRNHSPRFQSENFEANRRLVDALGEIASKKGCTTAQLAIAWVMAQGDDVVALVGTKSRARLEENAGAASVELTKEELRKIEEAVPRGAVAGDRYPPGGMKIVDR